VRKSASGLISSSSAGGRGRFAVAALREPRQIDALPRRYRILELGRGTFASGKACSLPESLPADIARASKGLIIQQGTA